MVMAAGVLMVEHKDVVVATTGRNREATGLVRVAFQNGLIAKKHCTELMSMGIKFGSKIGVMVGSTVKAR
jgi:hypothetical protein